MKAIYDWLMKRFWWTILVACVIAGAVGAFAWGWWGLSLGLAPGIIAVAVMIYAMRDFKM